MQRSIIYLTAGLVALFLQTTIFSHLPIKPDLVLVLTVCLGLSAPPLSGVVLAFVLGCITDVFAGSTVGFFALTRTVVFLLVYSTRGRLYFESYLAKAGLVSIAALIEATMLVFLVGFTSGSPVLTSSMGRMMAGPVLLTALFAPLCFMVLRRTRIVPL